MSSAKVKTILCIDLLFLYGIYYSAKKWRKSVFKSETTHFFNTFFQYNRRMRDPNRYTLLFVEDEAMIRKIAVAFLQDRFKEIYEASDGIEAYNIYMEKRPDLIITDIQMPRLSGLGLCEKIRREDDQTPIIILTAYSHTEYLLKATELNLIKYLIKPIEEQALDDAINKAIEKIESKSQSVVHLGSGYYFDAFNHLLIKEEQISHLSELQNRLLEILVRNGGNVVSYGKLESEIYRGEYMSKDAIRSLVRDMRKMSYKCIIENISKVGYRVNLDG